METSDGYLHVLTDGKGKIITALMVTVIVLACTILVTWIKSSRRISTAKEIPCFFQNRIPAFQIISLFQLVSKGTAGNKRKLSNVLLQLTESASIIHREKGIFGTNFWYQSVFTLFKAETIEPLLSSKTELHKSMAYGFLKPWLRTGLLTGSGEKWKQRRKLLTPAFHFNMLKSYQSIINKQCNIFLNKLEANIQKEWIDLLPWVTAFALDVISETAMGVEIQAQTFPCSEYVTAINEVQKAFIYRVIRPWLYFDALYYRTDTGKKFLNQVEILKNFTKRILVEKKKAVTELKKSQQIAEEIDISESDSGRPRKQSFIDTLLKLHQQGELSEKDICEEVDTFMFAGHDTTALGTGWALYNIGLLPEVQEKIQEELDSIFLDDTDREITDSDLKDMKYLECVLKESLRLYPSVFNIARTLQEDLQVGEFQLPRGSACYMNIYILHRDPKVFPNPEVFDPERFLPENSTGRHPYSYLAFSAGPRNCIGQKLAMIEEKTLVANILRKYSITSLDPRDKIALIPDIILRPEEGFRIKISRRFQKEQES